MKDFRRFLAALFPEVQGGFIELRLLSKESPPHSLFYNSVKAVGDSPVMQWAETKDVYFGICLRSTRRGNKEAVKFVWALWADLDSKDFEGGKEEALQRLKSFPISPSIIVGSGNGFHPYWLFREPVTIEQSHDIVRVETHLKGLAKALGADSSSAELARVLRLPGTFNHKQPDNPKKVEILVFEEDRRCNLSDFDGVLTIDNLTAICQDNPSGWIGETLTGLKEGNRNAGFAKLSGRLHHDGWSAQDIHALLRPHSRECGFPETELKKEIESICQRYPTGNSSPPSFINNKETETESKPFLPVKLSDFLEQAGEEITWAIDRLLPQQGVGILAGQGGVGKSWMLLDLAMEYARGGLWLQKFATYKGRVLYIDEESSPALLRRRLKKLLRCKNIESDSLTVDFIVGQGLCFNRPESVESLRNLMRSHPPDLLLIDSLIRVHNAEENSAKEMSQVFRIVKDIVREFKCAVLFADHQKKPNNFSASYDLLRGSSEKTAFVDSLLSLKRKDALLIVEHSKSRFDEAVPSFLVSIKDPTLETTTVSYEGEAEAKVQELRLRTTGDFIMSALNENWVPRKELVKKASAAGISVKMLDETLGSYVENGLIERDDLKITPGRGGKQAVYRRSPNNPSLFLEAEMETDNELIETVGMGIESGPKTVL